MLDLQKVFDTVSHENLLAKIDHYDIRGPALVLIKSFLIREQFVAIDGTDSNKQTISYGVAQGLILGPHLFCNTFKIYPMPGIALPVFLLTTLA